MLTAFWLLFPLRVERARARLEQAPWGTFWIGLGVTLVLALPITVLIALPFGPAKFLGFSMLVFVLSLSGLGAAAIVACMGEQLSDRSDGLTSAGAFVRGAVALELAAFFPVIGWFLVLPLAIIASVGATVYALLRWSPGEKRAAPVEPVVTKSQA